MEAGRCSSELRFFCEDVCKGASSLYEHLARQICDDPDLVEMVRATPDGQPVPVLFLAAVHYLLLSGTRNELSAYYPSCVSSPRPPDGAFPAFRDFCFNHTAGIQNLLASRLVQTNEVRRTSYLVPAFAAAAAALEGRPLALIEVGASAGLNLIWDRYAYDYGLGTVSGEAGSAVRIRSQLRGEAIPPVLGAFPNVSWRQGIDLRVIDVAKSDQARWLRALVWPDQPERAALQSAAIREFLRDPPPLHCGDALDLLPELIQQAPNDAAIVVFHCHVLNQLTTDGHSRFEGLLAAASKSRAFVQIGAEWIGTPTTELTMTVWRRGRWTSLRLARVDQHGAWIEWNPD